MKGLCLFRNQLFYWLLESPYGFEATRRNTKKQDFSMKNGNRGEKFWVAEGRGLQWYVSHVYKGNKGEVEDNKIMGF